MDVGDCSGIVETSHSPDWDPAKQLGKSGEFPFTRGPYQSMYQGRVWTMRQYSGYGSARETNMRFRRLLDAGQTGLSVAFDLPTQMGIDSDDPLAAGEVGRVGVAIDTLLDMRALLDGIPLDTVTTSMTINATAPMMLALYQLVAEERGIAADQIRGTTQNDMLKEYIARGTYIYPVGCSMRLVSDLISYSSDQLPRWNPISVSGYHIREAGSSAAQELAFTIANGLEYVAAVRDAGIEVDDFAPRLSFFWSAHNGFLAEAAKYRAARRMWARLMRDRVGAKNPASWRMRFHTQTAGSSLTAQQPMNNVVRTTIQALSAVLGGTQSLHTNAYDEALGLPTEASALLALRTQQVIAEESGLTGAIDPLAGSFYVERLTDQLEAEALALITHIDDLGGAVAAVESGFQQRQIEEAAYLQATKIDRGEEIIVGVNGFQSGVTADVPVPAMNREYERDQIRRLVEWREQRSGGLIVGCLDEVARVAATDGNLLPFIKSALAAGATVGEVSNALRGVFGQFRR